MLLPLHGESFLIKQLHETHQWSSSTTGVDIITRVDAIVSKSLSDFIFQNGENNTVEEHSDLFPEAKRV